MRTSTAPTPTSYAEAAEVLAGEGERQIANNTWLGRYDDDDVIAIQLHDVDLVTFHRDGTATYRSGGHNTMTTRGRLNRYAPPGVVFYKDRSLGGRITVQTPDGRVQPLGPGITLDAAGHVVD